MIDFIKINDLSIGLRIKEKLDFIGKFNDNTGEVLTDTFKTKEGKEITIVKKKHAHLKNLLFTITAGERFVQMEGSIHKFANDGEVNNDRFTFERFIKTTDLLKEFVSPNDNINSIEFAINLNTPFDPSSFITNILAFGKHKISKENDEGYCLFQGKCDQYLIKIYNKGIQQPTGENILRIEVKYLKMENLFKNGLKWSDLSNIETWQYLGEVLKNKFSDIIYFDPAINLNTIPEHHRTIIQKGLIPNYFQDLKGPHASRQREDYQKLIAKYGKTFNELEILISDELDFLVNSDHYLKVNENDPLVKNDLTLYGQYSPQPQDTLICPVTGIDISIQKPGSKFLCNSGLKSLYKNDPSKFNELRQKRLSAKWENEPFEIQIREIAHSIRNEFNNPRHNLTRDLSKLNKNPHLFDLLPLIRDDKRFLIEHYAININVTTQRNKGYSSTPEECNRFN